MSLFSEVKLGIESDPNLLELLDSVLFEKRLFCSLISKELPSEFNKVVKHCCDFVKIVSDTTS